MIEIDDKCLIPSWFENEPGLWIEWKEDENWDDVFKKHCMFYQDTFSDYVLELFDYEVAEDEMHVWPFSCTVYGVDDHFLISNNRIESFEELKNSVSVPNNYIYVLKFYKEMCLPFLGML